MKWEFISDIMFKEGVRRWGLLLYSLLTFAGRLYRKFINFSKKHSLLCFRKHSLLFQKRKKYRNGILIYIVMHLYKCIVIYKLFMMWYFCALNYTLQNTIHLEDISILKDINRSDVTQYLLRYTFVVLRVLIYVGVFHVDIHVNI